MNGLLVVISLFVSIALMHLREIQALKQEFERRRGWNRLPASLVYVHLIEELSEIGRHILFSEGYKVEGLGHKGPCYGEADREFAQAFNLFVQLANKFNIDLEAAVMKEHDIMKRRFDATKWKAYMESYDKKRFAQGASGHTKRIAGSE